MPSQKVRPKGRRGAERQRRGGLPARSLGVSRQRRLEDELARLLANVPSLRDRQIVQRILGWDGRGGCLIKHAGDEFGITRERARQVYDRAVAQVRHSPPGPLLDRVLRFVQGTCNQSAESIECELQRRGLTRYRFDLRALVKTAELFGRGPQFTLEEGGGRLFVVVGPGVVRSIVKAVQRSSTRYGVQTVTDICASIAPGRRTSRDRTLVRQILATRPDVRWLDAQQEWFWLAALPRNPVARCVRKLLAFASPASFADVDRAIRRLPRQPKAPLPHEALISLCRQAPFCRVRSGSVELESVGRGTKLVSHAEAAVCRVLRRHGGELPFERLRESCASAGVTHPNLWRIVLHSPLLFRSAPGTYRLITAARIR